MFEKDVFGVNSDLGLHNAVLGFTLRHHHATPAVEYKTVLPLVEIHI